QPRLGGSLPLAMEIYPFRLAPLGGPVLYKEGVWLPLCSCLPSPGSAASGHIPMPKVTVRHKALGVVTSGSSNLLRGQAISHNRHLTVR
uniref:Uncharacterized protein n=1 Tax=Chelonoidis abingdonii TaxID=106734 RepID=A0A8C0H149_CHEAB